MFEVYDLLADVLEVTDLVCATYAYLLGFRIVMTLIERVRVNVRTCMWCLRFTSLTRCLLEVGRLACATGTHVVP